MIRLVCAAALHRLYTWNCASSIGGPVGDGASAYTGAVIAHESAGYKGQCAGIVRTGAEADEA